MNPLVTTDLSKVYKQGDTYISAVRDVNLVLEEGRFAVLSGASGSGKSTLLNLCAGMLEASKGKILIDGENISGLGFDKLAEIHRRKTGFVFQDFDLLPQLTVRENIMLPSMLDDRKPDGGYFEYLTETLGIAERLEHFPDELSGGQIQRTAIARALINKPAILFADEPTGNLDRTAASEIIGLFLRLNADGATIMMVTHDDGIRKRINNEAKYPLMLTMEDGRLLCA